MSTPPPPIQVATYKNCLREIPELVSSLSPHGTGRLLGVENPYGKNKIKSTKRKLN